MAMSARSYRSIKQEKNLCASYKKWEIVPVNKTSDFF